MFKVQSFYVFIHVVSFNRWMEKTRVGECVVPFDDLRWCLHGLLRECRGEHSMCTSVVFFVAVCCTAANFRSLYIKENGDE